LNQIKIMNHLIIIFANSAKIIILFMIIILKFAIIVESLIKLFIMIQINFLRKEYFIKEKII